MTSHLEGDKAAERQTQEAIQDEEERRLKHLAQVLKLGWGAIAEEMER